MNANEKRIPSVALAIFSLWLLGPAGLSSLTRAAAVPIEETQVMFAQNPLFAESEAPLGAPQFDLLKPEHFVPAYEQAMARHRAEIDAIASDPNPPTFENTIVALERAGSDLNWVDRTFSVFVASAANDEIRAIQREMSPRTAAHRAAIALNRDLFVRIEDLYQRAGDLALSEEEARVLTIRHTRMVRAGARLEGEDRERLAEILEELATLYTTFSQNVQKDSEAYTLVLETEADRAGLPSYVLSAAAQAGTEQDQEGSLVVTLARSSFEPFMTFSTRRDLREQVWRAWTNRGDNENAYNNSETIRTILALRLERANLLGYETFADYRTADTMAGTPEAAFDLLSKVWVGAVAKAEQEADQLRAVMAAEGATHGLEPWDWWYYAEKSRAALYDLDLDEVKAYLSLDHVLEALFAVTERLFHVTFVERDDVPVYHPDVRVWEMQSSEGETLGLFYGDYFARPGKRSGAWSSTLRSQQKFDGQVLPLVLNNCNYNKPPPGKPALIAMREAETIFHEFGHALHSLLSDVRYPLSSRVDNDFVEFPAQIMEHWIRHPQTLQEFALHYETGEPMPPELLEKIRAAGNAQSGFGNVEFIASAFVDLAFHRIANPEQITRLDVNSFEDGILTQAGIPGAIEMRHRSPHFLHSFSGELYAGGYYTYLWAGVLDNDGFAAFEEAGDLYDPTLAERLYTYVYSAGNVRPAMDAYVGFRGREPSVEPLLINRGLKDADAID